MSFDQPNPYEPNPELKIWFDGKLVLPSEAKVSVFDHCLLYGDGVFEGMRSYGGKVFRLQAHLDRLEKSARAIRLEMPMTLQQLADATDETLKANNVVDGYIRLVVTRGVGTLGLNPARTANPSVIIIADQIELYPKEMYEQGMGIVCSSVIRNHPNALNPRIKSCNYLNNILAKVEAQDANVLECVMFNHAGYVAECTGDNLFLVRDGGILTPPISAGILEGITRQAVIELAEKRGLPLRELDLTRHDLLVADECFLTGSAAEVIPVTTVDNQPVGDGKVGPITKKLIEDFRTLVNQTTN